VSNTSIEIDAAVLRSSDAQYRYELLTQCPRLSDEQYKQEAERIRLGRCGRLSDEEERAAKVRIVQGYLQFVRNLACRWAWRTCTTIDLLDLIQAGNLALLTTIDQFSFEGNEDAPGHSLVKYLSKSITGAILHTIYATGFSMHLPKKGETIQSLKDQGQWETLCQAARSLDEVDEDGMPLLETLLAPELILSTDPEACPAHKAYFLALLLAELPPRQREVLRLRYGLNEDGISYSVEEVAVLLGVEEQTVSLHERGAKEHIQAISSAYEQETGDTSACLSYDEQMHAYLERRRMERDQEPHPLTEVVNAKAYEALTAMQERGEEVTGAALSQCAGISPRVALRFLHQRGYTPQRSEQETTDLLERTFTRMQERGELITQRTLARAAGVGTHPAQQFLQDRGYNVRLREEQERTERLEQAFTSLQGQGVPITQQRLQDAAAVSYGVTRRFLEQKRHQAHSQEKEEGKP